MYSVTACDIEPRRNVFYETCFSYCAMRVFCFCFLCLAAVNWYQGSELVSDSFDWNDTAKFSKLLNGTDTITSPEQISQLDFFVYAAKHYPLVSGLMIGLFVYFCSHCICL